MKALLIDPSKSVHEFITEIEIDDDGYTGIAENIGCDIFTTVSTQLLDDNVGYVDDSGLINGTREKVGGFVVRDYPAILAGRCVVLGLDRASGESKDVTITKHEAQSIFGILTPIGPVFRA